MGMKDPMRRSEGRVKGRFCKFYAGLPTSETPIILCRRQCKKRLSYSYSSENNFKLSMNLPAWNQIPCVIIFPRNTKTLVIL